MLSLSLTVNSFQFKTDGSLVVRDSEKENNSVLSKLVSISFVHLLERFVENKKIIAKYSIQKTS